MRRLPLRSLAPGERRLDAASARYLARVLRLRAGDRFEAFDPVEGSIAEACVLSIGREVVVAVDSVRRDETPEPSIVLVQGHPKGDKLGDVVRDATELGATAIVPAICVRSVARPDDARAASRAERLAAVAAEAARQCGRARAPTIAPPMPWIDALEVARELAEARFVLWEKATVALGPELIAAASERARLARGVAFAIGPEGGLTDDEVEAAERLGFASRSLGRTILRTETAPTAVLGALRIVAG